MIFYMRHFIGFFDLTRNRFVSRALGSCLGLTLFCGSYLQVQAQSDEKESKSRTEEKKPDEAKATPQLDFKLFRKTKVKEWANPMPEYPSDLTKLNNQRVKMRGFMAPYDSLDNMSNFMLMTGATGCFFCTPPSMTEALLIRQKPKKELPYLAGAIEVEGKLKLWSGKEEDYIAFEGFFYIIEDAEVKQVQLAPGEQSPVGAEHGF